MHDLPVFFHVDGPIVIIFHGRVVVRLVASSVVAGVFHVRVLTSCGLLLPRLRSIFAVILGHVPRRRAHGLGLGGLWLGLDRCCWGRCCGLGGRLIVIAGNVLAAVAIRDSIKGRRARQEHSQIVEDILVEVLVGHFGVSELFVGGKSVLGFSCNASQPL